MENKALMVIDIQNDITKKYKEIIDNINKAIEWAKDNKLHIIYIKHNNRILKVMMYLLKLKATL